MARAARAASVLASVALRGPLTRARLHSFAHSLASNARVVPSKLRLFLILLALVAFAHSASAQTNIYEIRGNASAGSNNIWNFNSSTGVETLVYTGYPGGNAATLAQRPSDGMIFYVINAASGQNGAVYRFNPATPSVAPVLLGNIGPSTSGGNVLSGFRMAFNSAGTLYYMSGGGGADNDTLYTVNQNTGQATPVATITGTGNGGDMAFNSGGTLYIINQNRQLYTATVAGGAATLVGTVTFPGGAALNTIGLAFDSSGRILLQTQSPANMYALTLPSLSATLIGAVGGGTTATGDLSSAVVPAPDISVTKSDGVTQTSQGATLTYTVTVKNNGTYTVSANLADTVPAALTGVTWTCVASAGSTCDAASGSGNTISTGATLAASGTATYTVKGTVNVSSGSIVNTATVSLDATWLAESNTTNNSATDTDTVVAAADLSITKAANSGLAVGSNASYTLTVHNNGPQSASGTITVTDTLPSGLSFVSAAGTGWTCSNSAGTVTCTNPGPLASGSNLPAITLTVAVAAAAAPTVSNTASVSNATFDPTSANNSSTATASVLYLSLTKSYTLGGPNPTPGTDITYTVAFSNLGGVTVQQFVLTDPDTSSTLKISDNTDFKVGSVTTTLGGFTSVAVAYSNNGGATYAYTPASGGGGAPAGYDRNVTHVRWTFTGTLASSGSGSVSFAARIR